MEPLSYKLAVLQRVKNMKIEELNQQHLELLVESMEFHPNKSALWRELFNNLVERLVEIENE